MNVFPSGTHYLSSKVIYLSGNEATMMHNCSALTYLKLCVFHKQKIQAPWSEGNNMLPVGMYIELEARKWIFICTRDIFIPCPGETSHR